MHVAGGYSATSGREECKEALASYEKHVYDIPDIGPLNITVGANSTQILFDLMCVLLDPGDKILMLDPSYCNYPSQIVTNTKAKIIRFPVVDVRTWTYDAGSRTQSFADFIRKEKPKVILLTSPDNPTSQVLPHDFVKAALVAVQSIGGFMVMDFAYKDMVFDTPLPEYFSWSPTPHFMSVHSNSKWCRGLGRRLGWVEASEEIIQALESVQSSTILAPDTLHQMALERYFSAAIKKDTLRPYIRKVASDYKRAAMHTVAAIKKYMGQDCFIPQGGLFTCLNVKMNGALFVEKALTQTGVLTVPGWGFGKTLQNAVRVSYGPLVYDLDKIDEGIRRLSSFMGKS